MSRSAVKRLAALLEACDELELGPEEGILIRRHLASGDDIDIQRMAFTYRLSVGPRGQMYYDDEWCYQTEDGAIRAMLDWDGEGEPEGWHRHVGSGRRRPDGDASREYVEP